MDKIKYSDINLYVASGGNELVYNKDSINQNILLAILTPIRSAWFAPSIGSLIPTFLFDPIDSVTSTNIKREIEGVLQRNQELRVQLVEVDVTPDPDEGCYYVRIVYRAPELQSDPISFEFSMAA